MFSFLKKRLGIRIALVFLAVAAIFALLMTVYVRQMNRLRKQSEMKLYEIHGTTLINNFSETVIFGLLSRDKKILSEKVDSLFQKDPTISYAIIYDEAGNVIYQGFREPLAAEQFDFSGHFGKEEGNEIVVGEVISSDGTSFRDFLKDVETGLDSGGGGAAMGRVRIGISLERLNTEIQRASSYGNLLIGALLVLGSILVLFSLRMIMPPINRLANAAKRISAGHFDVEVPVTSEDEIGLLTETFNEMVVNIRNQTQRAEEMIENIADAIMLLTETTSQLLTISTQQASGATEQAAIVEEVVATTEEISTTAARIADSSKSVNQSINETKEVSYRGRDIMSGSIQSMEDIREQVEKGTAQIMQLAEQANLIGTVIDIIEEISEQTNLLALNAAIEAAGAGEAGKRFSVVASEVRHLANRTLESTESVRQMVDTIQKSTSTMVMFAENEQKAVSSGVNAVETMGEHFQHILDMVDTTTGAVSEIGLVTQQQSTATDQMVSSIREVEQVAKEVEKGAKEIESSMSHLKDLTEKLRSLIGHKENPGKSEPM